MSRTKRIVCVVAGGWLAAGVLFAQGHGGGEGGGCGDVFGDLIHVQRDATSGQSILARRFVELPREVPGYGWGYCTIALTPDGQEVPFLPFSCDKDLDVDDDGTDDLELVEVDYFGRLSGGRTKERNQRMHFNEVISNIKMAGSIKQEPVSGRLLLGFDCTEGRNGRIFCSDWSPIDSPMESLGLFVRAMKYGHFQTDPQEFDLWAHGDPQAVPPFNPALDPLDWAKFHGSVRHLLPMGGDPSICFPGWDLDGVYQAPEAWVDDGDGIYQLGEPFDDVNGNGVRDEGDPFLPECAATESLEDRDFVRAGSFLGAAASKTGIITVDLVQYMNRIVKITNRTEATEPTHDVLPALVRDCEDPEVTYEPPSETDPNPQDPPYLPVELCTVLPADSGMENYDLFFEVREKFMDYGALEPGDYSRDEWRGEPFDELILPVVEGDEDPTIWNLEIKVDVLPWLAIANGPDDPVNNFDIRGFVAASSDAVRTIEFIHNYAVPDYLPYQLPGNPDSALPDRR